MNRQDLLRFVQRAYGRTTPRQRTYTLYGVFTLLAVAIGFAAYRVAFPTPFDYTKAIFQRDFTTDNGVHPVYLPADDNDTNTYDVLLIQNLGTKPLAVFAFTPRPAAPSPESIMSTWAVWIAQTKQAVTINPGYTWTIDPQAIDRLPFVHGRTWLAVFYEPLEQHDETAALPSSLLPDSYRGSFRVYFSRSRIPAGAASLPQLHRAAVLTVLQQEADLTSKRYYALPAVSLIGRNGLTPAELR